MALSQIWLYSLISVIFVSLVSFVGVVTFSVKSGRLRKVLIYIISLSAGTLLGDAFFHLLPETAEESGLTFNISLFVLFGIVVFFILEKVIHWQHCHNSLTDKNHVHPFAYTNLVGDALHNFLDGIIIAASYIISMPAGLATTIAVVLHEIPQEIGDFGVLLHGGFSKSRALAVNFLSAVFAILGAIVTLAAGNFVENLELVLVPIAVGGFIYIASSDLIPELHKHSEKLSKSLLQLLAFLIGIALMAVLLFLE